MNPRTKATNKSTCQRASLMMTMIMITGVTIGLIHQVSNSVRHVDCRVKGIGAKEGVIRGLSHTLHEDATLLQYYKVLRMTASTPQKRKARVGEATEDICNKYIVVTDHHLTECRLRIVIIISIIIIIIT